MNPSEPNLDVFTGIENASDTFARNYLKAGNFSLRIEDVVFSKSRAEKIFVAVEFTMMRSSIDSFKPGDRVNWMTQRDPRYAELFQANVRNFVQAAMSATLKHHVEPNTITKDVMSDVLKDRGELILGSIVECSVSPARPGKQFMPHVFSAPDAAPAA